MWVMCEVIWHVDLPDFVMWYVRFYWIWTVRTLWDAVAGGVRLLDDIFFIYCVNFFFGLIIELSILGFSSQFSVLVGGWVRFFFSIPVLVPLVFWATAEIVREDCLD